jgi:hypothetical protein
MKLFAATRSKRKFNNLLSFDEERPNRGNGVDPGSLWIVGHSEKAWISRIENDKSVAVRP